jgi:peptidoglycan/xylan/chitin deacetylase (PgdA/CDA1 family)
MKKIFCILFHAMFSSKDIEKYKHPYLYISKEDLKQSIELLLENQFNFLDPLNIETSAKEGNNVLITFDDGYYNNIYSLEVLEEFKVKALFFFVEQQIINQKLFWWDVYFLNRIKYDSFSKIYKDIQTYKTLRILEIENELIKLFGKKAYAAKDDLYRPMTIEELKKFSNHQFVEIGVHSSSHEILTNCSKSTIKNEIMNCKLFLEKILLKRIDCLSYPNGNYSSDIIKITRELGLTKAFTTVPGVNELKDYYNEDSAMQLKRNFFPIPGLNGPIIKQLKNSLNENRLLN